MHTIYIMQRSVLKHVDLLSEVEMWNPSMLWSWQKTIIETKEKIKLYPSYLWNIIDAIAAIYSEIHMQPQTNDIM